LATPARNARYSSFRYLNTGTFRVRTHFDVSRDKGGERCGERVTLIMSGSVSAAPLMLTQRKNTAGVPDFDQSTRAVSAPRATECPLAS
jgi:hypothetical protein